MDRPFTKKEKLELFLQRDGALMLSRVFTGIALGVVVGILASASIPLLSVAGVTSVVGCCVAGVTFGGYASQTIHRYKRKVLLDFYRQEIAASLGKEANALTLDDLEAMRRPVELGGKGNRAIADAMNVFDEKRDYYITTQAISGAAVVAGLFAMAAAAVPAAVLGALAVAGYNLVYQTVDSIGNIVTGVDEKSSLTKSVRDIAGIIERGGTISSTRVLELFVDANPVLSADIQKRFGQSYGSLSVDAKRKLVKEYDAAYNIYNIADDVNLGYINPQELGFLAFGQRSGVPRDTQVPNPHQIQNAVKLRAMELSDYTSPMPVSNRVLKADSAIQVDDDTAVPQGEMHMNTTPNNVLHADRIRSGRPAELTSARVF
jgi:hypothetical protein